MLGKITDTEARGGVRFEPNLNAAVRMDAVDQHLPRTGTRTSRENEEQIFPLLLPEPAENMSYYPIPYQQSLSHRIGVWPKKVRFELFRC